MRSVEEIKKDIAVVAATLEPGWTNTDMCELEAELRLALTASIPIDRLEAICQAEREGRCVVLPCKEGDTVYFDGKAGVVVDVEKCTSIRVRHGDPEKCLCAGWDSVWKDFASDDFGRTVFLARAQAEAAKAGDRHD